MPYPPEPEGPPPAGLIACDSIGDGAPDAACALDALGVPTCGVTTENGIEAQFQDAIDTTTSTTCTIVLSFNCSSMKRFDASAYTAWDTDGDGVTDRCIGTW